MNNPFLIVGYQGPEYFCDREKETEVILSALHNGRNITLVSPRRMGKTGFLYATRKGEECQVLLLRYFLYSKFA